MVKSPTVRCWTLHFRWFCTIKIHIFFQITSETTGGWCSNQPSHLQSKALRRIALFWCLVAWSQILFFPRSMGKKRHFSTQKKGIVNGKMHQFVEFYSKTITLGCSGSFASSTGEEIESWLIRAFSKPSTRPRHITMKTWPAEMLIYNTAGGSKLR